MAAFLTSLLVCPIAGMAHPITTSEVITDPVLPCSASARPNEFIILNNNASYASRPLLFDDFYE
jgi:hypothetical protein